MEKFVNCNAIVLRTADFGESSRMLTVFSDNYGILSVAAKGVRKAKSKNKLAAQLFSYGKFELVKSQGDAYTLTGFESIETFYTLGSDIDAFNTAAELVKILLRTMQPDLCEPEVLRLLLNCLYLLANGMRSSLYIRTVFTLRLLKELGMMPDAEDAAEVFSMDIPEETEAALAYLEESAIKDLFKIKLPDSVLNQLAALSVRAEREVL